MSEIKKLSSYQKMKQKYEAQIAELRKDIYTLVDEPSLVDVNIVKSKYLLTRALEQQVWAGSSESDGDGFLSQIAQL